MQQNLEPSLQINAKGLKCPMPVIKLQQQVRNSAKGQRICIQCTDTGAEKDIASWVKVNKHIWIDCQATDYGCDIFIEVAGRA